MVNRFLIVCGGSGSRLLGQRRVLDVNGELHMDVSSEIKARSEDPNSMLRAIRPVRVGQRGSDR
jgi:hypothetical protein